MRIELKADAEEIIQSRINEIGTMYPLFGAFDRMHYMNIHEPLMGLLVMGMFEHIMKAVKTCNRNEVTPVLRTILFLSYDGIERIPKRRRIRRKE